MRKNLWVLLLILLLGTTFRVWNIETVPHWYWDEGVNMNIAWNLVNGKMLWFSLQYPFVPHPPLFFIISGAFLKFLGNQLVVLRALSVAYSLASIPLLFLIGRKISDEKTGLLSAFLFSIYPAAIYWNRMAFANNQLMFLSLLTIYFLLRYLKEKREIWLYLVSLSLGLAIVTEILGFFILVSVAVLCWLYCRNKILRTLFLSLLPFLIFAAVMLCIMPDAFIHDILHNSGRAKFSNIPALTMLIIFFLYISKAIRKTRSPVLEELGENLPIYYLIVSIITFVFLSPPGILSVSDEYMMQGMDYLWLGIPGLFLVRGKGDRDAIAYPSLSLLSVIFLFDRTDHLLIPLHPFLCLGMALLMLKMSSVSLNYFGERLRGVRLPCITVLTIALIFYPIAFFIYYDIGAFINKNWLEGEDLAKREYVADLINSYTDPDDFVIADSHTLRFLDCRTGVLIQSLSHDGVSTFYMAHDYGGNRFVFNCSYKNARFIVMEEGTFERLEKNTKNQTDLAAAIDDIRSLPVLNVSPYQVYANQREIGLRNT
jgi:4-amino-4-deoxy-L-arabinose transferase-like glycosyltransferase